MRGQDIGVFWDATKYPLVLFTTMTSIAYLYLGKPIMEAFGYRVYKRVGANISMQSMYGSLQTFMSLLKMDFVLSKSSV